MPDNTKMKPVKAGMRPQKGWAVFWTSENADWINGIPCGHYAAFAVFARRATARAYKTHKNQRIARVLITEIKEEK